MGSRVEEAGHQLSQLLQGSSSDGKWGRRHWGPDHSQPGLEAGKAASDKWQTACAE